MNDLDEILEAFESWCLSVFTQTPPQGGELNIKEAKTAIEKLVWEGRLIELDLLEQALNDDYYKFELHEYKMRRLKEIEQRLGVAGVKPPAHTKDAHLRLNK